MTRYPLYIFDLDGTLYRGEEPIANAVETVLKLKSNGSEIRYLTNNSGQTREFFQAKLMRMGFPARIEDIYSTALGSAKHLEAEKVGSVFAIGEPGLVATLRQQGLQVVNADENGVVLSKGEPSEAVLVGICRQFTYDLMAEAMQRIRAGQRFVATNLDSTFPLESGRLNPGAGSIVAGIRTCTDAEPYVVGKPNPYLINLILEEAKCEPRQALAVGDRMDTDIVSGQRAGCPTFLVLTGVATSAPPGQDHGPDLTSLF